MGTRCMIHLPRASVYMCVCVKGASREEGEGGY